MRGPELDRLFTPFCLMHHRGTILVLVAAVLFALAEAKTLSLNTTKAFEDCRTSSSTDARGNCSFTDPKYWVQNVAPATGDSVVIPYLYDTIILDLLESLSLVSLQFTNGSFPLLIRLNAPLIFENLGTSGFVKLEPLTEDARVEVSAYLDYLVLDVNATFTDFMARQLDVRGSSIIVAQNLRVGTFTLQTSSLRCDSLVVDQYWTYNASPMPKVDCASIEIRGWDVWPLSSFFYGDLAVDTLKFNGDIDELNFDTGSFRVGNISFSGSVSKFRVSQNATLMTNSEILLNEIDGALSAPRITLEEMSLNVTNLVFNATVLWKSGTISFPNAESALTINGDLHLRASVELTVWAGAKIGQVTCGKVVVNGQMMKSAFLVTMIPQWFVYAPTEPATFITYWHSDPAEIKPYSHNFTVLVDATSISFTTPMPATLPATAPIASANNPGYKAGVIVLGVACCCLIVALIVVLTRLAKKKEGYQSI